jgi:hypothetical protein
LRQNTEVPEALDALEAPEAFIQPFEIVAFETMDRLPIQQGEVL